MNSESLPELIKRFPMGSKVVINGGVDCCAKVVGYHELGGYVLVYNPAFVGHSGNGLCLNGLHEEVDQGYLERNYREGCWYVSYDMVKKV